MGSNKEHLDQSTEFKDISIGNAYDKVAKLLGIQPHKGGLGHGAAMEQYCNRNPMREDTWRDILEKVDSCEATGARTRHLTLKVPSPGQLKFSYAGLYSEIKQFIERQLEKTTSLSEEVRMAVAHAFQHTAVEQLEAKLGLALEKCDDSGQRTVKDVIISGGVASNMFLRGRFESSVLSPNCAMTFHRIDKYLKHWSETSRGKLGKVNAIYPPAYLCTGE